MDKLKDLHKLIDTYLEEISTIISNITEKDLEDIEYVKSSLSGECLIRYNKLQDYIQKEYPVENPIVINGIGLTAVNSINNFVLRSELSKRYNEFHTLCSEYFRNLDSSYFDENTL